MKHTVARKTAVAVASCLLGCLFQPVGLLADHDRYPEYAQQQMPKGVEPDFLYLSQFADEIRDGKKPIIIDVRTGEEYGEAHILGSISLPLSGFSNHLAEIPKNRLVVLY